jgi:aminoacrylate hydrolase
MHMPLAVLDEGELHYDVSGTGSPLILLMPQSSGPTGRDEFADALGRHHTVIRYDQLGTGRSSPLGRKENASMDKRAAEVSGLARALGMLNVHLVCHSTGCGIGVALAAAQPAQIGGLVLTTPWTYADAHLIRMQNLRIAAARSLDPVQYAHFNASLLFPPEFRREHERGFSRAASEAPASPQDADTIAERLQAILAFDARPLLPAIECATLVVSARDDQLMPAWFGEEAGREIPHARYVEFDGGGHMLTETRGEELGALVVEFLAGVGSGP